jgi:hypothetical protein
VVRVTTHQNITSLRHLVDRRTSTEDMNICGVKAQIGRPFIAEADGEPISIRVWHPSRPELIADGCLIKCEAAPDSPVRVEVCSSPRYWRTTSHAIARADPSEQSRRGVQLVDLSRSISLQRRFWAWHDHSEASRRAHGAEYATYIGCWRKHARVAACASKGRHLPDRVYLDRMRDASVCKRF